MIQTYDLLIVGGGINGSGIAADAAGRGLNVLLCEADDLAAGTSSASSKLIHGGLRYLEQYDFKLVKEALKEREILLKKAPQLVHPLQFIVPQTNNSRPFWLVRLGLFFYDHLTRHNLMPASKRINLRVASEGQPLKPEFKKGFSYYDAQTDDARLVIANVQAAAQKGAKILTRTHFLTAKREADYWLIELFDNNSKLTSVIKARAVINAAGPWATKIIRQIFPENKAQVKLVKGSHIVIPKLYDGSQAYLLQNVDRRIIFVIPYQEQFTLIGTTDVLFDDDPRQAVISDQEVNYLCAVVNRYFARSISSTDVKWSFAGVRALYDLNIHEPAKMSREYCLQLSAEKNQAPLLSVLGGKLTTFRSLAEHALTKLQKYFPDMSAAWTQTALLPGGDLAGRTFSQFVLDLQQQYLWLPAPLLRRYARSYGSLTTEILGGANKLADLGINFGADLYEREVVYLIRYEWAQTVDDIIWRRTKLGLFLTKEQIEKLNEFIKTCNVTSSN